MTWLRDNCPQCDRQLVNSRFDTTFRMPDGDERLCFAIPAALCADCHQLYLDPDLLEGIRKFILDHFGFGDFVFRLPSGEEVARAEDIRTMTRLLPDIPGESLLFHAGLNNFSAWLKARTEFELARLLRPMQVSEFAGARARPTAAPTVGSGAAVRHRLTRDPYQREKAGSAKRKLRSAQG